MKKSTLVLVLLCIFSFIHLACLWDYDTIASETKQFPGIGELISGKFLRHSTEFYEWRIKDRQAKLIKDPNNLAYLDDMAVAYSKIHKNKEAIALMLKKDKIKPGLYETYANLGTFYLHDGQFEEGLKYITKAIEINPDAHFGREIYQKYLVEYILHISKNEAISLPLREKFRDYNFYTFLLHQYNSTQNTNLSDLPEKELTKAIKGVSGMVKFGSSDSPILMEALGDLLFKKLNADTKAARQLAAFSYYRAATLQSKSADSIPDAYKALISLALMQQVYNNKQGFNFYKIKEMPNGYYVFADIQKDFDKEIAKGEKLYQQIRKDEIAWIAAGENPEKKFEEKYYNKHAVQ